MTEDIGSGGPPRATREATEAAQQEPGPRAETAAIGYEAELARLRQALGTERRRARELARERRRIEAQYRSIARSRSWRYTAPIRAAARIVRHIVSRASRYSGRPGRSTNDSASGEARPTEAGGGLRQAAGPPWSARSGERAARQRLNPILHRLYGLGFTERPLAGLRDLLSSGEDPTLCRATALELAKWYARTRTEADARRCLEIVGELAQAELTPGERLQAAILEADMAEVVGAADAGKMALARILDMPGLNVEERANLYLAAVSFESADAPRIELINRALDLYGLSPIALDVVDPGRPAFDRLRPGTSNRGRIELPGNAPTVSVIMPVYNAADTIRTALESVLAQTWTKLEVIVADDCSSDATPQIVEACASRDSRVHVIRADSNGGAYVARNLALRQASGALVTTQDADDWSHPERIERQVRHLLDNPALVASIALGWFTSADLKLARRHDPGSVIRALAPTFMFRREPVMRALGYWDCVRFGADTELIRRVQREFGSGGPGLYTGIVLPTGPLAFKRQATESLTADTAFGYPGFYMGARREYQEAQRWFHERAPNLHYTFPQVSRPFPVPDPMRPRPRARPGTRRHFDVVLASDFRMIGDSTRSSAEEITAQARLGLRTGLIQMSWYENPATTGMHAEIRELIDGELVQVLVHGERVSCDLLIVRYPPVLEEWQRYLPEVEAASVRVIMNQLPVSGHWADAPRWYDIARCRRHLERYTGKAGAWHPTSPSMRQALLEHHASELGAIALADEDWPDIIDVDRWRRPSRPRRGRRIRIGRHSDDDPGQWPDDRSQLRAIYPDDGEYEVHVLGGATEPERALGRLPGNWRVCEPGEVHPREFLAALDVFVYYTHPQAAGSHDRAIAEAMAVGVPVVLSPVHRSAFGDAAVYAEPAAVRSAIDRLMSDDEYYRSQVQRGHDHVERQCGHARHAARLEQILGRPVRWQPEIGRRPDRAVEASRGKGYWARRQDLMYYRYVEALVRTLAADARSLIDVGSADSAVIERLSWIPRRDALDLRQPYHSPRVHGIRADFLTFVPDERYDFATCLQVLEHVPDAGGFARRLFEVADNVLVSVPYEWPAGTRGHVHDPVDLEKLVAWTGRMPDYHAIVPEPLSEKRRLIAYFHSPASTFSLSAMRKRLEEMDPGPDAHPERPGR